MIVSGLRSSDLDPDEVNSLITNQTGAIVTFAGVTRADDNVTALFYEAWENQAAQQLDQIANDAVTKWGLESALILHRTGTVPVGETSVICAAVASHRGDAFEACEYMIDTVKDLAAIWKQEQYAYGSTQWIGAPK